MEELLSRVTSLDPTTYRANRLTDAEREFYEREGYLVIPNAITSASDLAELQDLLGRMREENIAAGKATATERVNRAAFSVANHRMFSASDAMVRLLTNPKVFPKVVDMLGINISLYHVQINTVPPGEAGEEPDWNQAPTRLSSGLGTLQCRARGARRCAAAADSQGRLHAHRPAPIRQGTDMVDSEVSHRTRPAGY